MAAKDCPHIPNGMAQTKKSGCEECGSDHSLRVCSSCGHVGCCDSYNRHARIHAQKTGHQVMKSYPTDNPSAFTWCYACNDYLDFGKSVA
jgi:monovalent cation/hydrogen antiporter